AEQQAGKQRTVGQQGGQHAPAPRTVAGTRVQRRVLRVVITQRRRQWMSAVVPAPAQYHQQRQDRKSTRLNSSHVKISYAVFCLTRLPPRSTLSPYTTLFRSSRTAGRQTANRWPAGWTACPSAPDRRRYASAAAGPAGRHHAAAPPVDVRRCASSSAVSPAAPAATHPGPPSRTWSAAPDRPPPATPRSAVAARSSTAHARLRGPARSRHRIPRSPADPPESPPARPARSPAARAS